MNQICTYTASLQPSSPRSLQHEDARSEMHVLMVGWEINVPFQHTIGLYKGQGLVWRFSSARLKMANDTVTSQPHCLFVKRPPKWERIGEAHLNYYASTYKRVKTNQPPQDLVISSYNIA